MPNGGLPYRDWGFYYVLKGEEDASLDNLEKAIELGYENWGWLKIEEALDPLRMFLRFQALLEKAPLEKNKIYPWQARVQVQWGLFSEARKTEEKQVSVNFNAFYSKLYKNKNSLISDYQGVRVNFP